MTSDARPRRGQRVSRFAVLPALLIAAALLLSGCVRAPLRTPNDPGIPEAREAARERLDEVVERLDFSAAVTALGSGLRDDCDFANPRWFDSPASDYQCTMRWSEVLVVPTASTLAEIAVIVDEEIAAMGLEPDMGSSAVRALVTTHPDSLADGVVYASGHRGDAEIVFSLEEFGPDDWPTTVGGVRGVDASDVAAAGAEQIVVASASVQYWAEAGLHDLDAEPTPQQPFLVWQSAYRDGFHFDLAQGEPASAIDACLTDARVDQRTIDRTGDPFPRVTFDLAPGSRITDAGQVRDCLAANLTSGTLAWYEPFTGRGTTELPEVVPVPTNTAVPQ